MTRRVYGPLLAILLIALSGCAGSPPPDDREKPLSHHGEPPKQAAWKFPFSWGAPDPHFETVRIYFATDRSMTGRYPRPSYGPGRGSMHYGWLDVSMPLQGRDPGEIPRPWFTRLKGDPHKHVVILSGDDQGHDLFFPNLKERINESDKHAALIFVHGFNVSFDDAAYRTTQLAFDLKFPGPSIFFSWPSVGAAESYLADYDSVRWATPHLAQFLEEFAGTTEATSIYLIAHSMGNQALPQALIEVLKRRPDLRTHFKELVLAAPDLDTQIFRRDIAPFFRDLGIGVTLYASKSDRALEIARKMRANYSRAGDLNDGAVIEGGTETIDASDVLTDFILEHSYFADSTSILSDVYYLITQGLRAPQRWGLREVPLDQGRYWKIVNRRAELYRVIFWSLIIAALIGVFVLAKRWRASRSH